MPNVPSARNPLRPTSQAMSAARPMRAMNLHEIAAFTHGPTADGMGSCVSRASNRAVVTIAREPSAEPVPLKQDRDGCICW